MFGDGNYTSQHQVAYQQAGLSLSSREQLQRYPLVKIA